MVSSRTIICGIASAVGGWIGWHFGCQFNDTVGFIFWLIGASVGGIVVYKMTK